MTIATKNGSIIVKDGRLAENCGCCGGWYCCPDSQCILDSGSASKAVVTVSGNQFFTRRARTSVSWSDGRTTTGAATQTVVLSDLIGTHQLARGYVNFIDGWHKTLSAGSRISIGIGQGSFSVFVTAPKTHYYTMGFEEYKSPEQAEFYSYSTGSLSGQSNFVRNVLLLEPFSIVTFFGEIACGQLSGTVQQQLNSNATPGSMNISADSGNVNEVESVYSDPSPIVITISRPEFIL